MRQPLCTRANAAPTPMLTPRLAAPRVSTDSDTARSATLRTIPMEISALCGGAPRRHGPWHHGIAARCGGSGKASPGICSPAIYPRVGHRCSRQLADPGFRWPPGVCVRCLHCRPGCANPTISTSYQALYGKLGRMDPKLSEAIVRFCAEKLRPVLEKLPCADEPILAGYRTQILDGNVLTEPIIDSRRCVNGSTPACRESR